MLQYPQQKRQIEPRSATCCCTASLIWVRLHCRCGIGLIWDQRIGHAPKTHRAPWQFLNICAPNSRLIRDFFYLNPSEMVGGQQFGSPNPPSKPRMAPQIQKSTSETLNDSSLWLRRCHGPRYLTRAEQQCHKRLRNFFPFIFNISNEGPHSPIMLIIAILKTFFQFPLVSWLFPVQPCHRFNKSG